MSRNTHWLRLGLMHDDVIKWKHFLRYWPFVRGIHQSPVNSPHKGQWRGALMFSMICVWIYGWVNNREADDLRRYCAHYDVTVMSSWIYPHVGTRCALAIARRSLSNYCWFPRGYVKKMTKTMKIRASYLMRQVCLIKPFFTSSAFGYVWVVNRRALRRAFSHFALLLTPHFSVNLQAQQELIEAKTRWLQFRRRHFQTHFLECKCLNCD